MKVLFYADAGWIAIFNCGVFVITKKSNKSWRPVTINTVLIHLPGFIALDRVPEIIIFHFSHCWASLWVRHNVVVSFVTNLISVFALRDLWSGLFYWLVCVYEYQYMTSIFMRLELYYIYLHPLAHDRIIPHQPDAQNIVRMLYTF